MKRVEVFTSRHSDAGTYWRCPLTLKFLWMAQVKNNETAPAPPTKHDLVQGALSNLTRDAFTQPLQLPGALSDLTSAIKG